mgnify:FL=1|tara:strand:+ start:3941 stop:4600 length:660 start_codon:yes stop_codon:yes gene_type:complete
MKTKITIAALLSVLFINAASAESPVNGNVGTKFASDYHRRGAQLSNEAIQAQVGFNVGVGGVDLFGDFHTNQGTDSEIDTNELTVGLGADLFDDKLSAYVGLYNTDSTNTSNDLEAYASLSLSTVLSPSISVYRDTDDALYTFEGTISHTFDLNIANLQLAGILGNTDATAVQEYTYTGAKATLSKTVNDINLYTDIGITDTESRDNETVWGVGLSVKF